MALRSEALPATSAELHPGAGLTHCIWFSVTATGVLLAVTKWSLPTAGPLSQHMIGHIIVMSVLAPMLATAVCRLRFGCPRVGVVPAALLQLLVIWGMHAPPVLSVSMDAPLLHAFMGALLLASSTAFWLAVLGARQHERWRSVAALLLTGKLFCLLAALLVFSPRALYPALNHGQGSLVTTLSDQQLAGLLMITVCPLSYVLSAVVIVVIALREVARDTPTSTAGSRQPRQA